MFCEARIPESVSVTLISGFLGAGKTTLLNHLLTHVQGQRLAVLVNDFGAINIDSELIVQQSQSMLTLANGCMCCTIESDLIAQLEELLGPDGPQPERLLIEASGLSSPQKIASTLRYPQFRQRLHIDAIITLVDAEHYAQLPESMAALAQEQLDVADIIVLNKVDRVTSSQLSQLKQHWLYPGARIIESRYAAVAPELLLGYGGSTFGRSLRPVASSVHAEQFVSHSFETPRLFRLAPLRRLLRRLPEGIYRAKGVLRLEGYPDRRCLLHLVGMRSELTLDRPAHGVPEHSQLVLIGLRGAMDPERLRASLLGCLVPEVTHGEPVAIGEFD
ncbi:CobW family GTP-binding protein [Ectopseudomonas mendocina]|uniref:CobW family GTP-binding protein n=1 Tax=Ectopseudomonas mendocina TaxID=300 RepID=A0ABZ2RHE8_ECTME